MKPFDYLRPADLDAALAAGARPGAAFLGGGTNLLDLMKTGAAAPGALVDVSRLPGLDGIETTPAGELRLGAALRNADLARAPEILAGFPMLAEAALSGASAQVRNAATLAGNLLQRPRCPWLFQPEAACGRRDPGAGCAARAGGADRQMAVLGWSEACLATHPSDLCVALAALDATVEIAGPSGRREIAFADLHRLPGDAPAQETALAPGELILALRLPAAARAFAPRSRYVKLRERTSFAFALVSAAAALRIEDGRVAEARLALGGVAAKPWRAVEAEAALAGAEPTPAAFAAAAEAALAAARPSGDNADKIEFARRVAVRALTLAAGSGGAAEAARPLPAWPGSVFSPAPEEAADVRA